MWKLIFNHYTVEVYCVVLVVYSVLHYNESRTESSTKDISFELIQYY